LIYALIIYSAKIHKNQILSKSELIYFANNPQFVCVIRQFLLILPKICCMKKILAENVRRLCKEQGKQMKDLAADMGIDPASLTRALNGNARLDTVQKIANALGVSMKSLFEPLDDVEGFIRIKGRVCQFNSRQELNKLLNGIEV
jgi:transcriptional regulator with XRE-family HTH domain